VAQSARTAGPHSGAMGSIPTEDEPLYTTIINYYINLNRAPRRLRLSRDFKVVKLETTKR
jgi:hypothetical protein